MQQWGSNSRGRGGRMFMLNYRYIYTFQKQYFSTFLIHFVRRIRNNDTKVIQINELIYYFIVVHTNLLCYKFNGSCYPLYPNLRQQKNMFNAVVDVKSTVIHFYWFISKQIIRQFNSWHRIGFYLYFSKKIWSKLKTTTTLNRNGFSAHATCIQYN